MALGDDGAAVAEVINGEGASPYLLVCEHASRHMPARFGNLGLPESELSRHIAWDIGAGALARRLSAILDAPLVVAGHSRLIVDLNRPPHAPAVIPELSETTAIPGNTGLSPAERARRLAVYFHPFQATVAALLDRRIADGRTRAVIGIHSFTPVFKGFVRPWRAGVLFRRSERFGNALVAALGGAAAAIAANEPYRIEEDEDYTVPVHGEARGLAAVLVEIRQDLIGADSDVAAWAERLAAALGETAPLA